MAKTDNYRKNCEHNIAITKFKKWYHNCSPTEQIYCKRLAFEACVNPKDLLDNPITIGCTVAVATLDGHSATMAVGVVRDIDPYKGIQVLVKHRTYGDPQSLNKYMRYGFPNRLVVIR